MFKRILHWSLSNPLIVIVLFIVIAFFGGMVLKTISMDVFPEFAPPQVVIQTEAPGFSPEDIESLVTFPLESAVNGTPGVETVRSSSSIGLSTITVVFNANTDPYRNRQLINEKISLARDKFPEGVRSPVMLPLTSAVSWLIKYALYTDGNPPASSFDLRTFSDWEIRNRLLAVQGVASVVSLGGDVKQYQVLISPDKLRNYRLTLQQVVNAIKGANLNVPGGFVYPSRDQEYVLSGQGRIHSLDDLKNSVIEVRGGAAITLSQVADVKWGPEIKRGDASFKGKPAVIGTISKLYGADTLKTTYQVEKVLKEIQGNLPSGMKLDYTVFRQASFIETAVKNLDEALIEGGIVVTFVLLLFLFNFRAALISFLAMPASLIMGIIAFKTLGIGINSMTLGGLVISLGIVVDDAIIVVENILRRLNENLKSSQPLSPFEVVLQASNEIIHSVVYATAIIMVVFLPVFFLSGLESRIFTPLALAYIFTVFASLLVALTLTPVLSYLFLVRKRGGPASGPKEYSFVVAWLKQHYESVLKLILNYPGRVVGIAVFLFLATLPLIPFLGKEFLPEFREGNFIISLSELPGTSLEETLRLGNQVQQTLMKHPEVVSVNQRAGRAELDEDAMPVNFSEFDLSLRYGKTDPDQLVSSIRKDLSEFAGTAMNIGQFISHRMDEVLSGVRAQIAVKIFGPDLTVLREKGSQIKEIMGNIQGIVDLQMEQQVDVPGMVIQFDRAKAARYGLTVEEIGKFIEMAFNGITVSQVLEGQKTFDLYVRFAKSITETPEKLGDVLVDTPTGIKIPLNQLASVQVQERPFFINRENIQRRILVQSNVAGKDLNSVISRLKSEVTQKVQLPQGYYIEYAGQFKSQQAAQKILIQMGLVSLLIIFVLLYKVLGTARLALIVMVNLPLALIGGVIAVFATSRVISIPSLIGFVALFGIATRNGVILITHYQYLIRAEGLSLDTALLKGSLDRLSPILMTAGAAALGLIPLLLGSPTGKELERPMAWVLLGGLFTSTFLNMMVVPALFKWLNLKKDLQPNQESGR